MSKINISLNNIDYKIDESKLAEVSNAIKTHLSTTMTGTGATINFGGSTYNVDSTKLSTARNKVVSHLGTISGSGHTIKVGNTSYSVAADKIAQATSKLEKVFDGLSRLLPGLYDENNNLVKTWEELLAEKLVTVSSEGSLTKGVTSLAGKLVIDTSVTSIGQVAFKNCSSLISVSVPASVTSIGDSAFSGCSVLQDITIPFVGSSKKTASDYYQYPFGFIFGRNNYTDSVPVEQFYYGGSTSSTARDTYYIPATLTSVVVTGGDILCYAFHNCSNLTSVTISDSVISIGDRAFQGCSSLTSVTISDSVTSIGAFAFYGCAITSVIFGENSQLQSIGDRAFYMCNGITSVTIGNVCENIGQYAFYLCSSLASITFTGTTSQWNAITKGSNWKSSVPATYVQCTDGQVAL